MSLSKRIGRLEKTVQKQSFGQCNACGRGWVSRSVGVLLADATLGECEACGGALSPTGAPWGAVGAKLKAIRLVPDVGGPMPDPIPLVEDLDESTHERNSA